MSLEWESGEITWEPLSKLVLMTLLLAPLCEKKHGLDKPGWKKFKKTPAANRPSFGWQSSPSSTPTELPVYQCMCVPRSPLMPSSLTKPTATPNGFLLRS
jgi:hypothetical protein